MSEKGGLMAGFALVGISVPLFLLDMIGGNALHLIMGLLTLGLSALSGRNIAYLVHDSIVLKKRSGRIFSPSGMMAMWMFFFIVAVVLYVLTSAVFFKSVSLIVATVNSSYLGLVYSTLLLLGSYYIFKGTSGKNMDRLYSSWGKRIQKMQNMSREVVKTGMDMFRRSFP